MKNPLTLKVESWIGMTFIILFSAFLIGLLLIAIKNFNSDSEILSSASVKLKTVSPEEKSLIDQWLQRSDIGISAAEVGYRYIIKKFPDKPWVGQ